MSIEKLEKRVLKRQKLYNKEMQKALLIFKEFADKNNITFWLDWGTLLGAVRDKQFIPWEQDIDLGFFRGELNKVIDKKEEIEKFDFKLFKKLNGCALVKKGLTAKIDLYVYEIRGELAIFNSYKASFNILASFCDLSLFILNLNDSEYKYETLLPRSLIDMLSKSAKIIPFRKKLIRIVDSVFRQKATKVFEYKCPKEHFETLDTMLLFGKQFKIPSKSENLLEHRFGNDWRTPICWDDT